jgi:hypothetical protein
MASIKISELTSLTPPAAADELAVVDVSANSTKKTTVGEVVGIINGDVEVANNGTATISELPVSKLQDGAARQLLQTDAAGTGVEWTSNIDVPGTLDVTGAATVGKLNVAGYSSTDVEQDIHITRSSSGTGIQTGPNLTLSTGTATDTIALQGTQGRFGIWNYASSSWVERFCVTGPGNVGIGTSSPGSALEINAAAATSPFIAKINTAEAARIDGSGRLLVGKSSARSNVNLQSGDRTPQVQIETAVNSYSNGLSIINNSADGYAPQLSLGLSLANTIGSNTNVAPTGSAALGMINFVGNDGDQFLTGARIEAVTDAATGNGDMPSRLVFSVTQDGSASPTEAMRIKNSRIINFANAPTYADNTAALAGGLVAGDVYRKSDGTLMIAY